MNAKQKCIIMGGTGEPIGYGIVVSQTTPAAIQDITFTEMYLVEVYDLEGREGGEMIVEASSLRSIQ